MSAPSRIKKLINSMSLWKIDALLVTSSSDIAYLTQYPARDAWLLLTAKQAFYITDSRYIEEVRRGISGVSPVQFTDSIFKTTISLCHTAKVRFLGIEQSHLSVYHYSRLKSLCNNKIKIVFADGSVERLRMIKDAGELGKMRKALKLNLQAYELIKPYLKPGTRESDILLRLEAFIRKHGVGFSFDPIIASGPNSAYPHARVTDRKLRSKEPVLIDLGIDFKGYKSDLTRMFFLDKMPASFRDVLLQVRAAQLQAFRVIRPGVMAKEVDAAARNYLQEHGLAAYFTHSLGHGVGMDVHEQPRLSQGSSVVLEENMVFTVEPGVYFPGKYGIRLEEMVRVTKKGCEVLSGDYNQ